MGDVMAPFMGNVTPVFEHEVYIVEPPIVMYVPIREDLPYKDSIRLDLHDELGRPLAWDKGHHSETTGHPSLQDKGISYGLPDNHITQQCE